MSRLPSLPREGSSAAAGGAVNVSTVWERYVVGVSRSARSRCRACGAAVDRGAVRVEHLKKMSDSSWRGSKFHFSDCFVVSSARRRPKLKEEYRPGDVLVVITEEGMTGEEIEEVRDFFKSSHPGESVGAYKWRRMRGAPLVPPPASASSSSSSS